MPTPEEVFRFVNVRPAQIANESRVRRGFATHQADQQPPILEEVRRLSGTNARQHAADLARRRLADKQPIQADVAIIVRLVPRLSRQETALDARRVFREESGEDVASFLAGENIVQMNTILWDWLYAHTLAPEERPQERADVYAGLRALHFLRVLATQPDDEPPMSEREISAVTLTIPRELVHPVEAAQRDDSELERKVNDRLDAIAERVSNINATISDLRNNERVFRERSLQHGVDRIERSVEEVGRYLPTNGGTRSADVASDRSAATVVNSARSRDTGGIASLARGGGATLAAAATTGRGLGTLGSAADATAGASRPEKLERETLTIRKEAPWMFGEFGRQNLAARTRDMLVERKLDRSELEVAEVIDTLSAEKHQLVTTFMRGLPEWAIQMARNNQHFGALLKEVPVPNLPIRVIDEELPRPGSASARGIQPLGIGDLLVVRQELLRYTMGEVAHIENVLESETKKRLHSRMREIEETVITETEELEETEKDLQTTERFELAKEAQKTIESDMSIEAGIAVTATYGPVSVQAHADFALSESSSESSRVATTFARQVTDRSVSRVLRRAREERTRRTLERFEERNEHGFDNTNNGGHVIGVYRWVDKYYRARVVNYGRRLMMEFIVPEPAAFFLQIQSQQALPGLTLTKPAEPRVSGRRLEPSDLTKWNYMDFVAAYNVQDVDPYPEETLRVSAAVAEGPSQGSNVDYAKAFEKLNIPKGYAVSYIYGASWNQGYPGYFGYFTIGGQPWSSATCTGLTGVIPMAMAGWLSAFEYNVVAVCNLLESARSAWKLKAYEAIMNAYERALATYNEQVAAAQIQAGVQIQGRNPGFNRRIEQDELKKGALRLLTNDWARTRVNGTWRLNESFDAMTSAGAFGYPEFTVSEALVEGKIIQFFEQAFEWQNMTYRFYPYQWARKNKWKDLMPLTDTDPLFTDFLRSGAARVIVPVHESYNEVILHYLATNEIWTGGQPPTLLDPLFISIVDELKADAGADVDSDLPTCDIGSGYPCEVSEWEVKLPTTLVYLQQDSALPDFQPA